MLYKGRREGRNVTILAGEQPLPSASHLFHHAQGREWGHLGSEPAQLALDLLFYATQDPTFSLTYHQQFKQEVVSKLPIEGWTITSEEVYDWIDDNTPYKVTD